MTGDRQPLAGLTVLVTRSSHQSESLSSRLTSLGATAIEIPVISIEPPEDWQPLDFALKNLDQYEWLVFASVNAVRFTADRAASIGVDLSGRGRPRVACIGSATAEAASRRGLTAEFQPGEFVGEGLVAEFPGYPRLSGVRVLWPRTDIGRTYVIEKLAEAGADVDAVVCYRTCLPPDATAVAARLLSTLAGSGVNVVTLASSQTVRNLAALLRLALGREQVPGETPDQAIERLLAGVKLASIGPQTSATARKEFGRIDIEAATFTMDGLVEAIVASLTRRPMPET